MTKTKQAYVVIGRVGEYSDAREWCVRVFLNEGRAEAFAKAATEHGRALAYDSEFVDRVDCGFDPLTPEDLEALTKYDTTLVYVPETGPRRGQPFARSGWMYCGDSPDYTVCPCLLDDEDDQD